MKGIAANCRLGHPALSTYDTDYLWVRSEKVEAAVAALVASGHSVKR